MASITEVALKLGVSEKTVRRRIKAGKLTAILRGNPGTYDIEYPDGADGNKRPAPETVLNESQIPHNERPPGEKTPNNWVREYIDSLKNQLKEKDRQIGELHVLLQRSQDRQEQILPVGRTPRRFWWPFG